MQEMEATRRASQPSNLEDRDHPENLPIAYAYLIGLEAYDQLTLVSEIESGFPFETFTRLQEEVGLDTRYLAELISIAVRTLSRRKSEGRFKPDESDRLLRFARIFTLAMSLFEGNKAAAQEWLSLPNSALQGKSPLELSRTDVGAREVEGLAFRLEHGVFA